MQYTFHWILGESEKTPLGDFINNINEKVNDLSELLEETYATMQKEYLDKGSKIKELYDPFRDEYEIEYQKLLRKRYEQQEAYHVSNLRSIDEWQEVEEHELFERKSTLEELFFNSMLITLYSLIESELSLEIKEKSLPIFDYDSIGKQQYLQRILDENGIDDISYKELLNELRIVRNSIVHNKSVLSPINKEQKLVLPLLKRNEFCTLTQQGVNYELTISNIQFLRNYIKSIHILFNQVIWAIDKGNDHKLLKSRLIYFLKFSDEKVSINAINVNYQLTDTVVNFEGRLPSHQNKKYEATLLISDNLNQRKNSLIMSISNVFELLRKDGVNFLYNTTLKGFVSKEQKQKARLSLSIVS